MPSGRPASCTCAGLYTLGSAVARIDESRTPGELAWESVAAHELGHWLGLQHVCRYQGEAADCSPVGYGPAVMNPSVYEQALPDGADAIPTTSFTTLDLLECNRVGCAHRRTP